MGGIYIKDKELLDMINKVGNLKSKDESQVSQKVDELKNTIGKEKVESKLKEIDEKYGDQLNDYVKKIEDFKQGATSQEKAEMILEMKKKLNPNDQKKLDKILKLFKSYMKDI
ncbi:hypothetical protein GC105_08910 [Alkalibaculum sp. M08DMB]|uniref:Uncharacterized protein n=2 Tax=Alkalibaculum sporogenes TaxID=2655001 RepID=A0A6A7K8S8_9FIRM|nr:hypothetical protein [Alkalibaculum sporogenes]